MNLPLVTITIPTRNSSKTIERCLESIHNQTYKKIEVIIVDSYSADNTLEIAKKYSATIIQTEWKLLGARYLGVKASNGEYILLLDSDQILYEDTIERLINLNNSYDMACLEEESYTPQSFLERLFNADRKLIHYNSSLHLDPIEGVMLARFYKSNILREAFDRIPIEQLHDVVAHDHAIIYYEAFKISSRVGVLKRAVLHKEPSSIPELWKKNYRYGRTTKSLLRKKLYTELVMRKTRFRKGMKLDPISIQSMILLSLKGIPYFVGLYF